MQLATAMVKELISSLHILWSGKALQSNRRSMFNLSWQTGSIFEQHCNQWLEDTWL